MACEQYQREVREPCGDLGKSTEGGGNSHCKGPRNPPDTFQDVRGSQHGREEGNSGTAEVKKIHSKCRPAAPERTSGSCSFLHGWWLGSDHSLPKQVSSLSSCREGSRRGMGKLPRVAQLAKGRARAGAQLCLFNHQARLKRAQSRVRVGVGAKDGSQLGPYSCSKARAHTAVHV